MFQNELIQVKKIYIEQENIKSNQIAEDIREKIKSSYETIRTVSMLSEVRSIDKYGQKLTPQTTNAIQQIYNNSYDNIKLSEIYILPKKFDHDHIDPQTLKAEEPIISFDEFITEPKRQELKPKRDDKDKIAEIEVYEYALHKKQLKYLQTNYGQNLSINKIKIPLISGPAVITCDNSEFTKMDAANNDDSARMGIVFTVPKYDLAGQLNGAVSAILRINILKSYLPNGNYGLVNLEEKNQIINKPNNEWNDSVKYFKTQKQNPSLIYSKIIPVNTMDKSPWYLWVAIPDNAFYNSLNYKNTLNHFYIEMFWVLLVIGSIYLLQNKVILNNLKLEEKSQELLGQKLRLQKDNMLLQVLSHDVSNTLTVIKSGMLVLQKLKTVDDDSAVGLKKINLYEKIKIANDSAINTLIHVKELKALESGKINLELKPTSIDDMFKIANVIFENSLKAKDIKLSLIKNDAKSMFLCHSSSFSNSVFNNIISNAIKFSPTGSEIIIRVKQEEVLYKIFIQDFGVGIPVELAQIIFDSQKATSRLGTNGEVGTGFGLSLAKSYIEHYGGNLSFSSTDSGTTGTTGTTFEITLQRAS